MAQRIKQPSHCTQAHTYTVKFTFWENSAKINKKLLKKDTLEILKLDIIPHKGAVLAACSSLSINFYRYPPQYFLTFIRTLFNSFSITV